MSGSMQSQQQQVGQKQEFVIRIAPKNDLQRWSILKFNQADNVDPAKWTAANNVHLEREDNKHVVLSNQSVQEYGEGTEYGKAARDEARRKKYGRQARHYNLDHQPWHLNFQDNDKRERKFNSIREGDGHADYWIFMKQGDEFHAHKIDEMHRFSQAITHKTLDADAAEEKFQHRNKVMNQFALKAQILSQVKGEEEEKEIQTAKSAHLKIKDGYSSDEEDEDRNEDDEDGAKEKKAKKKTKAQAKTRKDKRQRVENSEDVAKYESSDGEDEGREYDYMTDSGSDSDREDVKVEEKMEKELVGVGDESGLKKMMDSDESESDSDEDIMRKILNGETKKEEGDPDVEDRDSSGSDTDDPDKEKVSSVVFMPNVQNKDFPSASAEQGKKRPAGESADEINPAKKSKSEPVSNEGLNEETVRKYLRRKPHTTKELLSKVKGKCGELPKAEIVTRLAAILKAIEPQQFKQKVGKKEVLFFSLGNQLAR